MLRRLRRLLPSRQRLSRSRWLSWLGPRLHHPALWRWSRHEVALGGALGVFFSLIIPILHIPLAAGTAVALRANLPAAVAGTLLTNPVTVGPLYYAAYRLGLLVVGPDSPSPVAEAAVTDPKLRDKHRFAHRFAQLGKPLLAGMAIMATVAALATYTLTRVAWWLLVLLKRPRPHGA